MKPEELRKLIGREPTPEMVEGWRIAHEKYLAWWSAKIGTNSSRTWRINNDGDIR